VGLLGLLWVAAVFVAYTPRFFDLDGSHWRIIERAAAIAAIPLAIAALGAYVHWRTKVRKGDPS
jgi:hypothetical protein